MDKNDNIVSKQLTKISTWNKWDLHIHTPASNEMVPNDYDNADKFSCELFIKQMLVNDIKMAVITDHNIFDAQLFEKLVEEKNKALYKANDYLCLLPGVEINVEFSEPQMHPIHFILIFNNNVDYNELSLAIQNLNQMTGFKKGLPKNASIDQIADAFKNFEYIVSIHLGKNSNSPKAKNYDEFLKMYIAGFINICENNPGNKINNIKYLEHKLTDVLKGNEKESIFIVASDNHDITKYPLCDNAEESPKITYYKAIPTFEGLKMVMTESTRINNDLKLPKYINKRDDIKKIEAMRISGDGIKCDDIYFARELNTIIGPRTSGKSLFINILKKVLEGDYEKDKYSKYVEKLDIKIKTFDDDDFKSSSSVKLEIISQNSLMEELDKANKKTDFFEIEHIKEKFSKLSIDHNIICEKFKCETKKEIDFLDNLSLLYEKIKDFNLPNAYIKSYVNYDKGESKIKNLYSKISLIKNFGETIKGNLLKINYIETSVKNLQKVIDDDKYVILKEEITSNILDAIKYLENKKIEINKITNVLTKISLVDISSYKPYEVDEKFIKEHSQLIERIKEIAKIKSTLDEIAKENMLFKTRNFKIDEKEEYEKSSVINNFTFKCSVKYVINYENDKAENIIENKFYKEDLNSEWSGIVNKVFLRKLKNNTLFKSGNLESIKETLLNKIPNIEKTIIDEHDVDIKDTSPGNRASILIMLILENLENKILILDQPEDNIDSKFITDEIVNRVKKMKTERQIFIVTHNANIVVNSDSENIIVCKNDNNIINYQYGAIEYTGQVYERLNMKQYLLDNLEGGKKAFEKRNEKYSLKGEENRYEDNDRK